MTFWLAEGTRPRHRLATDVTSEAGSVTAPIKLANLMAFRLPFRYTRPFQGCQFPVTRESDQGWSIRVEFAASGALRVASLSVPY